MLYDRWQEIVREHRAEVALAELATGRRWTFAQLDEAAARLTPPENTVARPSGTDAGFVLQTLGAWRHRQILCPIDAGGAPPASPAPTDLPSGAVHLKLTSATTGRARLVLFTADQLAADAAQIVATMGLRPDWPNLGGISLAHSYGFSNLVLPLLLHGIPLHLLPAPLPESLRRATETIGAVTLPAVPALWRAWHEAGVLTPHIRLAISAGAPLSLALERAILESSGLKVHNFYGSTECGGIAYDRPPEPRPNEACVGAPMQGVTLTIGAEGCLEVSSRAVGTGYWPDPDPALAGGVFRTSDLAELRDGLVHLQGRAGDQINVAGRKITPETIEQALRAGGEVADCLVFGVPGADAGRGDLIVACVVAKQGVTEGHLKQQLLARLPAWQVPKEWRLVETLQPNARGKLSRAQWRARLGYQ